MPFKGAAEALTKLLADRLDYMYLTLHPALPHIMAGNLRALATDSDKRLP